MPSQALKFASTAGALAVLLAACGPTAAPVDSRSAQERALQHAQNACAPRPQPSSPWPTTPEQRIASGQRSVERYNAALKEAELAAGLDPRWQDLWLAHRDMATGFVEQERIRGGRGYSEPDLPGMNEARTKFLSGGLQVVRLCGNVPGVPTATSS